MAYLYVLSQTGWQQFMLVWDKQIKLGFPNFQNFTHGFGFDKREVISQAGEFKKSTRRDFARAVTRDPIHSECIITEDLFGRFLKCINLREYCTYDQ